MESDGNGIEGIKVWSNGMVVLVTVFSCIERTMIFYNGSRIKDSKNLGFKELKKIYIEVSGVFRHIDKNEKRPE